MKTIMMGALALGGALLPAAAMAMSTPPSTPPKGPITSTGGSSGGTTPTPIPEPATMLVLGGGLASLTIARKFGRPKR